MTPRLLIIGTLITAVLHTGVLAKIVTDRAAALQSGQEVILQTGFVDPRDLFRGHYTILNFEIETLNKKDVEFVGTFNTRDTIFIELDTSAEFATPKRVTPDYPTDPTGPVIEAQLQYFPKGENAAVSTTLPFKRFYAPKDRALELQNMQRERKLGVILSVADDGSAMIKGLTIEGNKIYEEPLY